MPGTTKMPESGVGDEAYFSKSRATVFNLSVKKGGTYFRVMARSNLNALGQGNSAAFDEKDKQIDRTIARVLLEKL